MRIPGALEAEWRRDRDWVARLPTLVDALAAQWHLVLEEPFDTPRSFVVPAGDVVLKLNAPAHREADHEADALACWAGCGAVRLLERDDERRALLIERCRPGTPLTASAANEHEVVADLLTRLRLEPRDPRPFRSLADEARRWADQVSQRYERGGRPFERALLDVALDVFRTADRAAFELVNQDLHGGNVLRAEREPWLVIDPKPLVGEAELNAVGLVRNAAWQGGTAAVRRWLDVLDAIGLDRERARAWGVAHALAWGWDDERGWSARSIEAAAAILAAR